MAMLPSFLPICSVSGNNDPFSARLLEKLIDRLASHGIRASLVAGIEARAGGRAAGESHLAQAAGDFDLVFIDAPDDEATALLTLDGVEAPRRVAAGPSRPHFRCGDERQVASCADDLLQWLIHCHAAVPVRGCVLIGGRSSRMGRPKHLLPAADGRSWLEYAIERLNPFVADCVISGAGAVPASCAGLERIADLPGIAGPLAGVGAVVRRYRWNSWLVLACDLPDVSAPAIRWLLTQRRPGAVAVIPRSPLHNRSEPLFAWYDFRCAPLLAELYTAGVLRISTLCGRPGVHEPLIPDELCHAWRNVNRAEEL